MTKQLIEKLISQCAAAKVVDLLEDYSTNPVAPNDTTYVGFFFEPELGSMSKSFKERFAEAVKAIDAKESEFRTRFGDDWRNMAMMEAFKLLKESEEDSSNLDEAKEIGNEMDDLSTEELENIFKDRRPGILYSRYYKTDSKGYYQYLVVRKMHNSYW